MKDRYGKEIEFAPQISTEQFEDIAEVFFPKILKMEYRDCWVSDESSLTDFPEEKEIYLRRIQKEYNLDVSDIENLILVRIFERINIIT